MSEWTTKTLDQVVELRRGFDLPHGVRRAGPYPVLTAGASAGSHDEGPIKGPGFVVGRATNLGVPTWSDTDYWPLNTTLYASDFKGNLPKYLYHLFEVLDLAGYDSGSVQPMLNRNYIAKIEVAVAPLDQQRAIAEVLGALDNKIAANVELASTAGSLASALFADAVHGVELSDDTFDDIADVRGGGTPRTGVEEYWDGDINWVTPTDVTGLPGPYLASTSRRITKEGLEACASPLYPPGSIMMTSRATIGAFAVAQQPTAANQGFIVVNSHDLSLTWWIFHEMCSRVDEFICLANGATFLELSRGNFKKFRVRLADESTMKEFGIKADALHSRARQALVENARLAETRDLLLPMLMSGKIQVSDAELTVGDVI